MRCTSIVFAPRSFRAVPRVRWCTPLQGYYANLHAHRTTQAWCLQMQDFDELNEVIGTDLMRTGQKYERAPAFLVRRSLWIRCAALDGLICSRPLDCAALHRPVPARLYGVARNAERLAQCVWETEGNVNTCGSSMAICLVRLKQYFDAHATAGPEENLPQART